MFFEPEETYRNYNEHPAHVEFVNNVWLPQVEEFLQIDSIEADL